ncbi:MAG: PqqD family protein, partial [Chthoniobacter sp.]
MTTQLLADSRVSQVVGPISADLNGEIAILDPASGLYFGLNEVGAFIWKRIGTGCLISEISAAVRETYEVPPEDCDADILQLLEEFLDR